MGAQILLLESEHAFAQKLLDWLWHAEPTWRIEWTDDTAQAIASVLKRGHDGALLSWDSCGIAVCQALRQAASPSALVILAKREAVKDRVLAMKVGADDFITKHADPKELCARVHVALLRAADRRNVAEPATLSWGPLVVCLLEQQVFLNGRIVDLTRHQWLLLVRMMRTPTTPVPPIELCQFAGIQTDAANQNLRTEMRRLRQRLGDAGGFIRALRGLGYCLTSEVEQRVGNDT